MQEVHIRYDLLEGMSCCLKEVAAFIKWRACDCSWIY